jgi:hypothetical protein
LIVSNADMVLPPDDALRAHLSRVMLAQALAHRSHMSSRFTDCRWVRQQRLRSYHDFVPEPRLLSVGVECYAGHRGEQTPRTLILGDRRIVVAEVVDAWLAPDYRYFKLRGADGNTYLVRHDGQSNTWELTMFCAERISGEG